MNDVNLTIISIPFCVPLSSTLIKPNTEAIAFFGVTLLPTFDLASSHKKTVGIAAGSL